MNGLANSWWWRSAPQYYIWAPRPATSSRFHTTDWLTEWDICARPQNSFYNKLNRHKHLAHHTWATHPCLVRVCGVRGFICIYTYVYISGTQYIYINLLCRIVSYYNHAARAPRPRSRLAHANKFDLLPRGLQQTLGHKFAVSSIQYTILKAIYCGMLAFEMVFYVVCFFFGRWKDS